MPNDTKDMTPTRQRPSAAQIQALKADGEQHGFHNRDPKKKPGRKPSGRTVTISGKVRPEYDSFMKEFCAGEQCSRGAFMQIAIDAMRKQMNLPPLKSTQTYT